MLSERLRGKTLFVTTGDSDSEISRVNKALDMLEECVDHLILLMRTIEAEGMLPREDIEDCVIEYIESYEVRYYSLEEDGFDKFLKAMLKRRLK